MFRVLRGAAMEPASQANEQCGRAPNEQMLKQESLQWPTLELEPPGQNIADQHRHTHDCRYGDVVKRLLRPGSVSGLL
jgi:hypothetical protein